MSRLHKLILCAAALVLVELTGCEDHSKDQAKPEATPAGRAETRNLEAADIVGYNGKALRRTVDKVLDRNDQRNQEVEKDLKQSEEK